MVTLTNVGTVYDGIGASKGLGLGIVNFTGALQVRFVLSVSKVGTGTQSWQLWNQTDGTEIGVIADAAAAAERTLDATFNVALTGEKIVRVRCKSTVGADDPILFGAAILVK